MENKKRRMITLNSIRLMSVKDAIDEINIRKANFPEKIHSITYTENSFILNSNTVDDYIDEISVKLKHRPPYHRYSHNA